MADLLPMSLDYWGKPRSRYTFWGPSKGYSCNYCGGLWRGLPALTAHQYERHVTPSNVGAGACVSPDAGVGTPSREDLEKALNAGRKLAVRACDEEALNLIDLALSTPTRPAGSEG